MIDSYLGFPLFICLLVLLAVWVAIAAKNKRIRLLQRQSLGLEWLRFLKGLISHVQKHRGLSNAYLNGNEKVMPAIQSLQTDLKRDIEKMSTMDDWVQEDSRWQNITQHVGRLTQNFVNLPVDNNMNQHNQLIQSLLFFVDDVAQQYDLLLLKSSQGVALQISWREVLRTAEYIGQARAVGTGVAVLNHCDSVSRIRLNYLCRKIEENTSALWRQIKPDDNQRARVSDLLQCITEQTIKEKPEMDSDAYFSLATSALDSLYSQYDGMVSLQQREMQEA